MEKKLREEISDLKHVIVQLSLSLFKDKKLDHEKVLDLLIDAVIKKNKSLAAQINEHTDEKWRL